MTLTDIGRVGIGTIAPAAEVEIIHDNDPATPALSITKEICTSTVCFTGVAFEIKNTAFGFPLGTRFVVRDTGSVGIGTANPLASLHVIGTGLFSGPVSIGAQSITTGPHADYLLSVDGKVVARRAIATAFNWADDEFTQPISLQDLEAEKFFSENNNHLSGVPSEQELKQSGIDLAEMDALQMRKIEQLFRYLFIFHKEHKLLKKQYNELKAEVEQLKKELREMNEKINP